MPLTKAQTVRNAEAMHRTRGERLIKLWVPKDATPEELKPIREMAAALCTQRLGRKEA